MNHLDTHRTATLLIDQHGPLSGQGMWWIGKKYSGGYYVQ